MAAVPEPDPARWQAARELAERAAAPAVAGVVRCGTAGWADKTLIQCGRFYPRGTTSAAERLAHYARHFAFVEVDATFYTLLAPEIVRGWVAHTPPSFRFDVKAHPVLTGHPLEPSRLPGDLRAEVAGLVTDRGRVYADRLPAALRSELERRFALMLEPLQAAGRLGAVLCQFPPWFSATRGNARVIEALAERQAGTPLSIEFRHPSWLEASRRERVFDLLRRHDLAYVAVDEPAGRVGGVPPVVAVTSERLAVVRFHGRNVAGWSRPNATVHQRFDYLYAPDELDRWVEPVKELAAGAREVHAVFNNCVRDYAVLGAKGLSVLLAERSAG